MHTRISVPFCEVQRFTADQWQKLTRFLCLLSGLLLVTMIPAFLALNRAEIPYVIVAIATVGLLDALVFSTLFRAMELRTEERPEGLLVHFRPFNTRTIPYRDIGSVSARRYDVRRERGWGYSVAPGVTTFSVSGNVCVEIVLRSGKRIVIGTQRPEELAAAIERHLPGGVSGA